MGAVIRLDYEPLREMLTADGWEVQTGQVVHARREDGRGVWHLAIDRGGRVRFVQTRPLRPEQSRRIIREDRHYRLLRQEDVKVTIVGRITGVEDLRHLLTDLPALLQHPGVVPEQRRHLAREFSLRSGRGRAT